MLQKRRKSPHSLHPTSTNANTFHNHGTFIKNKKSTHGRMLLSNLQTTPRFQVRDLKITAKPLQSCELKNDGAVRAVD